METATDIIDTLGEARIAGEIRVTVYAVRRARRLRAIPSSWYPALCRMADMKLPEAAFTFKGLPE
jgi:hypothetical protein